MNKTPIYYSKDINDLELYQKLIQYWNMIFDVRRNTFVLDNMNYNASIFPTIFRFNEIEYLHRVEPGYMSPDGYNEINEIVRALEYQRLVVCTKHSPQTISSLTENAGVGGGNGCTNTINALIHSIIRFFNDHDEPNKRDVILTLPNYTVYTAQLSNMRGLINPRYVYTDRIHNFLPTCQDIIQHMGMNTAAVVLTYPTNPSQSSYTEKNVDELRKIVQFCQENRIFLIVDNIYQDMIYDKNELFQEVFGLTSDLDYVIKVYGSSKDTPFFSGYRTGYWFGDNRLTDYYRYYISSTENSLNTYSMTLFALNMYMKILSLSNQTFSENDMEYFDKGLFGWSELVDKKKLFSNFNELDLQNKYQKRINISYNLQKSALEKVTAFTQQSKAFSDYINQGIGNVFFIKVNPEYYTGSCENLFNYLLKKHKLGVLPGSVFGMPSEWDENWFRITLIHDSEENIISNLQRVENALFSYNKSH